MRRHVPYYYQGNMFQGRELLRLLSMIGMLGVLGMLIYRASDPDLWRFLAPETENAAPEADQPEALVGQPDSSAPAQNAKPDGHVVPAPAPRVSSGSATAAAATAKPPAKTPPPKLVPTGPTDLDPEPADAMSKERQAITDRTLYIQDEENACLQSPHSMGA